jgi:hypothetical protein
MHPVSLVQLGRSGRAAPVQTVQFQGRRSPLYDLLRIELPVGQALSPIEGDVMVDELAKIRESRGVCESTVPGPLSLTSDFPSAISPASSGRNGSRSGNRRQNRKARFSATAGAAASTGAAAAIAGGALRRGHGRWRKAFTLDEVLGSAVALRSTRHLILLGNRTERAELSPAHAIFTSVHPMAVTVFGKSVCANPADVSQSLSRRAFLTYHISFRNPRTTTHARSHSQPIQLSAIADQPPREDGSSVSQYGGPICVA